MSEPYLVAHKVRGEPAFDIAIRMSCPLCAAEGCFECDEVGYWWIIPTSGHRAYPYWNYPLWLMQGDDWEFNASNIKDECPVDLPDHYPTASTPSRTHDIAAILGLAKPEGKIRRR